jgi:hypothetical protein
MRFCWTHILQFGGENLKSYGKISRRKEVKRWRSLLDFSKHPSDGWHVPPVVLTGWVFTAHSSGSFLGLGGEAYTSLC